MRKTIGNILLWMVMFCIKAQAGEVTIFFYENAREPTQHLVVEVLFQGFEGSINHQGKSMLRPVGDITLQEHAYQSTIYGHGVYTLKFPGNTVNVLGIYVRTNEAGLHRTTDKHYFADQQSIRVDLQGYQVNISELGIAGLSN